jgi:hypothetical protein
VTAGTTKQSAALALQPNAFDLRTFCIRNNMGLTTVYKANKAGFIDFVKLFGKTVVTAEAEAKFQELLKAGKLEWPPEMRRNRGAKTRRERLGSSPLRA